MARTKRKPTVAETIVALTILLILACVAAGVLITQQFLHPAVSAMQGAAEYSVTGATKAADETKAESSLVAFMPEGFTAMADYQTFNRDTLSDKINGKADGYLQAGFEMLQWQAFAGGEKSDLLLQAYIFDMGSFPNAFSVYSRQRRSGAIVGKLTANTYIAGNALCFVHGQYYVELIGSAAHEEMVAAMEHFGELFVAATLIDDDRSQSLDRLFPPDGMVAGSLSLVQKDVFGLAKLNNVYTAQYKIDSAEAIAFVSMRDSPIEAGELAQAFAAFWINEFDADEIAGELTMEGGRIIDLDGYYEIIFAHGRYLAGVHQATEKEAAELLAGALAEQIKQANE